MRVGVFLDDIAGPQYLSTPLSEIVARAKRAEKMGFHSAWVPHVPMSVDALVALAMVGNETATIEIGSAVIPIQTRHPVAMAQEAATVQSIAAGRLTLGLGVSHRVIIEQMLGLSFARPATQMREYLEVLQELLATGRSSFQGSFYRVAAQLSMPGTTISGKSVVPTLIAGLGPVMLDLAGTLAGGTILWMANERAIAEHVLPRVTAAASAAARSAPRIVAGVGVCVCDDAEAGRDAAAETFAHYGDIPSYAQILSKGSADQAAVAITGNERAVTERLRSFASAGVTDLVAFPFGTRHDPTASLEMTWEVLSKAASSLSRS